MYTAGTRTTKVRVDRHSVTLSKASTHRQTCTHHKLTASLTSACLKGIHKSLHLLNKEACSLTQPWTTLDSGFEHGLLNSVFSLFTGQVSPMDLCCHHLTEETNLKASCVVATDTGFDSPAGAVALHRDTSMPDRFHPAHTCCSALLQSPLCCSPLWSLTQSFPPLQLTEAAAFRRFLKAQFRTESYSNNVL